MNSKYDIMFNVNDEMIYYGYSTYAYTGSVTIEDTIKTYALGFELLKYTQSVTNAESYLDEIKISAHKIASFPAYYVGKLDAAEPIVGAAKARVAVLTGIGYYGEAWTQSTSTTVETTYSNDTATVPEGAATAKVFFFDTFVTAKPIMKSVKVTIE